MHNEVTIENIKIKRFKVKDSSKGAPVLLEFEDDKVRDLVLKNNKKLRNSEKYSNVYINTDQTPSELEANKKLRAERKKRNDGLTEQDGNGNKFGMYDFEKDGTKEKYYWGISRNELTRRRIIEK